MKRWLRLTLAVVVGLTLGWYVAGLMPSLPYARAAETSGHGDAAPGADAQNPAHEGKPEAAVAADKLVVSHEDTPWLRPVLWAVGGLFVAAIVLGIPALKLRGPESPDPAAVDHAHDDQGHDAGAHGHDDHGHAAAGGHGAGH